ncbi:MAG: pectinesterase family protein [Bacteroides sp.]|nr:pectinesterase family protein [Bacteroides sp.]
MNYKTSILLGICALMFTACSDDENTPESPQTISFTSQAGSYATRVNTDGDQWLSGDQIGAYMLEAGTHTALTGSANVIYTAEADGASATFSSSSAFTYPDDGSVDFIGYYPYASGVTDFLYPVALANQSTGSAAHDLMRAASAGYAQGSTLQVPLSFSHQLSKVIFRFTDTEGETIYPDQLVIRGMNTTATFDLTTATLENEATVTDITPYKTPGGAFEAIVIPAEVTSTHTIAYTMEGESYTWDLADTENIALTSIEAGYKYTFTISHPDGSGKVEIEGGSVTPWENEEPGEDSAALVVNYTLFPANEATDVFKDTYLKLTFTGAAPEIGTTGSIRVYRAADHTLVDEIDLGDTQKQLTNGDALHTKMDILGNSTTDRYRVVNYAPVTTDGHTATIKLHYNKLEYDTEYYVLIDSKVIRHSDFFGVKDASKWTFTTKKSPDVPTDQAHTVTVGGDDSDADFRTIQAAMDFLVTHVGKDEQKTVYIYNGIYEELLFLRGVNNLTLRGESREGVIIRYDNYNGLNNGTGGSLSIDPNAPTGTAIATSGGRALFLVETVDKLRFESLTIENTHVKTGSGDQAETIYANNDNNALVFIDCNLISCQDTVCLKGFCWFYNSLVAGDVDFIWGYPAVALFEKCEIRSVNDGYIVQARVSEGNVGFVFLECELATTGTATKMYLSRAGEDASYRDNISFIRCKLDEIYLTHGWGLTNGIPNPSVATLENGHKIYGCTDLEGNSIRREDIDNWEYSYELSDTEYDTFYSSRGAILLAYIGDVTWFTE